MLIHRLRNALMIFSSLLIYSNAMKWRVWSVCLDCGAVVIVWTALKMSQKVFFLHNLDFYYSLYLLPKSKIYYDSPSILFLQAIILPSELLLEANFCEALKKMKSFERLWLNKKSTKTMSDAMVYIQECTQEKFKNLEILCPLILALRAYIDMISSHLHFRSASDSKFDHLQRLAYSTN